MEAVGVGALVRGAEILGENGLGVVSEVEAFWMVVGAVGEGGWGVEGYAVVVEGEVSGRVVGAVVEEGWGVEG